MTNPKHTSGDLVERLQRNSNWRNEKWQCVTDPALLTEAADRIEALQAEVERLRGVLRYYTDKDDYGERARAALGEKQ